MNGYSVQKALNFVHTKFLGRVWMNKLKVFRAVASEVHSVIRAMGIVLARR